MAKRADTWMPLFIGDYLRDTTELSASEHGAYVLLIMQAWLRNGLLPDDDARLQTMARMTVKDWRRSRDTILGLFQRVDGGYRHKRVEKELIRATRNHEQRIAAGLASADGRKRDKQTNDEHTEDDMTNTISAEEKVPSSQTSESEQTTQVIEKQSDQCNGRSLPVDADVADEPRQNLRPLPSPSDIVRKKESANADSSAREMVAFDARKMRCRLSADEEPRGFIPFWDLYPRKNAKGRARKAWVAAIKRFEPEVIVAGLKAHQFTDDSRYIPYASTWLHDQGWLEASESDGRDPTLRAVGATQDDVDAFMANSLFRTA